MIRKASFLVVGAFVLLGAGSAQAQGTDPLMVGNRVRLTLASQHRVEGRVVAADEQTLTLLAGDQPVKVLRTDINAAEMSVGRRSAWLKGAAIGAVAGIAIGFAIPVDKSCPSIGDYYATPGASCPYGGAHSRSEALGASGFGGAILGGVIGAFVRHDVWAPTQFDHVRVGLVPNRHGGAMQVSVAF